MIEILAIIFANLFIGGSVGLCGIAGFLLPIFYTDLLGYSLNLSLMLSFLAFAVSGIFGALNYKRLGNFNMKLALKLSLFSVIGAFIGSKVNMLLDPIIAKKLLYGMVLFSGLMLIFKKNKDSENNETSSEEKLNRNFPVLMGVGIFTSIVCALTGAGGPILTVPILVILGVQTQTSIGIALFQSIFIAIPSVLNYSSKIDVENYYITIMVIIVSHAIGVLIGSKLSSKIDHIVLKKAIAHMTVVVAVFLFLRLN